MAPGTQAESHVSPEPEASLESGLKWGNREAAEPVSPDPHTGTRSDTRGFAVRTRLFRGGTYPAALV